MAIQSRNDERLSAVDQRSDRLSPLIVTAAIASIAAAWIAADAVGFLGDALRQILTCILLGTAVIVAVPGINRTWRDWTILAGGALLSVTFASCSINAVNVVGVALMLATLAYIHRGLEARLMLVSSLAVSVLAIFSLASTAFPVVWLSANWLGWILGKITGTVTGRQLSIGATFGGVDFLVLMAALYLFWLTLIAPPRRNKAVYAAVAIVLAQFTYLIVLAYAEKIVAALPEAYYIPETDSSLLGAWAWQNVVRGFLPWNLPLLALVLQLLVAWCMFRWVDWLPLDVVRPEKAIIKSKQQEVVAFRTLVIDSLLQFGPAVLAVLIAVLAAYAPCKSNLKGKTIAAYEKGRFSWQRPDHNNSVVGGYGMLPVFVESLGARFVRSADLSEADLDRADVLIILHTDESFSSAQLKRIENFVRRGGSLLLGAENLSSQDKAKDRFNEVLKLIALRVHFDTVIPLTIDWEQSYERLYHPAGFALDDSRNPFGFQRGVSIGLGWSARPIVIGRWCFSAPGSDAFRQKTFSFRQGQRLGDQVLAAEQTVGQGRVAILGDLSCMNNERLCGSWEFVGRLLGYLAHRPSSPQDWWRQALGILALILLLALLAYKADAMRVAVTCIVLAAALISCVHSNSGVAQILPDGRKNVPNKLAYIDASHLEAYSSDLWNEYGIGEFTRVLMRNGYLPLCLRKFSEAELQRAGLFVSMAPGRRFSAKEREIVREFVEQGGTFLCIVGAEEVRPISSLLKDFQMNVTPSPILPDEELTEPYPLGAFQQVFTETGGRKHYVTFYAAWPLKIESNENFIYVYWADAEHHFPVVGAVPVGSGVVAVIADTFFAINRNLGSTAEVHADNIMFWRWLLPLITGQQPWKPSDEGIHEQGPADLGGLK